MRTNLMGIVFFSAYLSVSITVIGDDYWDPAAAPRTDAGKLRTLNQIEPRNIISALPYAITNSGSYTLAGVLDIPVPGTGIVISASHVKLDLNGFAIRGTNGSFQGIAVIGDNANISIRNGVICNWGGFGVDARNCKDVVVDFRTFSASFL